MPDFSFSGKRVQEPEHVQPVQPPRLPQAVVFGSPLEKLSEVALDLFHLVRIEKEFEQGIGKARGAVMRYFFGLLHIL
jgi:hypothetical protein